MHGFYAHETDVACRSDTDDDKEEGEEVGCARAGFTFCQPWFF